MRQTRVWSAESCGGAVSPEEVGVRGGSPPSVIRQEGTDVGALKLTMLDHESAAGMQ